jgi:hypothetical protein
VHRIIPEGDVDMRRITRGAELELQGLWRKAQAALKIGSPEALSKFKTLEVMPEEVKALYARVLAAQALVDGRLDPREIEYLYVFMSRIDLGSSSRGKVRQSLDAGEVRSPELVGLVAEVISEAGENEREIAVSIIKEMTQVSRADGAVLPQEQDSIKAVAEARFGEEATQVIELADKSVEYDEALIKGEISVSELEEVGKQLAALSTAVGVPLAAVYFAGSVVGLSAAGITSGLAALGLGGILGVSAMVTGIGVVIIAGAMAYVAVRWALGSRERELKKKREHMIQEVLKQHQKAIEDLAEDIIAIASKLEEYVSQSDFNEASLARLKSELQMFKAALAELKEEKGNLEARSEQYAT